jgi:hypothetical protein
MKNGIPSELWEEWKRVTAEVLAILENRKIDIEIVCAEPENWLQGEMTKRRKKNENA